MKAYIVCTKCKKKIERKIPSAKTVCIICDACLKELHNGKETDKNKSKKDFEGRKSKRQKIDKKTEKILRMDGRGE